MFSTVVVALDGSDASERTLPVLRELTGPDGVRVEIVHVRERLVGRPAGPLHVNEIYNRLMEGGFSFTGHNPTISIAVSLNRNSRFRKVAPGTFDLVIRDAAKAS